MIYIFKVHRLELTMVKIFRIGYNTTHDNKFFVERPNGYQWYLLLLIKSPAIFLIHKEEITIPSNTFILYDKHFPHSYRANGAEYKNDWIHFELSKDFIEMHPIPMNTLLYIGNHYYITDVIQKLSNEFYSNNLYKEQTMEYLMHLLFIKTIEQTETKIFPSWNSRMQEELVQLRSEIYSNPNKNWSIPLMAHKLHISCGHLQNIYKETFFTSCMSDVIESRITYGKELLTNSVLSVREISYLCGYQNEVHFMRQFKKLTDLTPSEYRKLNKNS